MCIAEVSPLTAAATLPAMLSAATNNRRRIQSRGMGYEALLVGVVVRWQARQRRHIMIGRLSKTHQQEAQNISSESSRLSGFNGAIAE